MRVLILFFIGVGFTCFTAQAQSTKTQLCSHAWQQGNTSIIWNFKEEGSFSAILFWGSKHRGGFTAKKGTYIVNDAAGLIKMTFDSSYSVYSKDSFSIHKDAGLQEWHIVKSTADKIIISRPPMWEFENKQAENDSKNILVILRGSKKSKGGIK